ncbi:MAG: DMT family transporter [Gammaproteobacteria bacterium]|nr:DMT family transporter [Gammaproteobacteria bacterium]
MNPVLGGGLTALGWGTADFVARFTGTALGHVTALFAMLGTSAAVMSAIVWWLGIELPAPGPAWWPILLMGLGLMLATMLLYQGLVRGPVTVVAPIVGSFPAFNLALALVLGARPALLEWLAMLAVMAGVITVARAARHFEREARYAREHLRATIWISIASAALFALTVAAGQEAALRFGELEAVCAARWVSFACCALMLAARREMPRVGLRWWPVVVCQGLLDGGAYLALVSASEGPASALTAVVASTFSAVTVVLARVVMREGMSWAQWGGVALILGGVAGLSWLRG